MIDSWNIPKQWTWVTLNDIAQWGSGGTPKSSQLEYYGGDIPWLIIADLNDGVVSKSAKTITDLGLKNSSAKLVNKSAILIAMYGSIGKLGIAGIECTTNQAIAFTKSIREGIDYKFLFYYLLRIRPQLLDLGKGGTQANISQTVLKKVEFPLPPLNEQKRIVVKLEKLLAKVNESCDRLSRIPIILKRFRQSVLAAACSGRLTADWRDQHPDIEPAEELLKRIQQKRIKRYEEECAKAKAEETRKPPKPKNLKSVNQNLDTDIFASLPNEWTITTFDQVSNEITVGYVGSMSKEYKDTGIPFLRSLNVKPFRFEPHNLKFISREFHQEIKKSLLSSGTIVIVRSGNAGTACVIPDELKEANCSDLVITRPSIGLDPNYACIYLNSSATLSYVERTKVGIAQGHFNVESMRKTLLPLPPIEEQKEIVKRVEALFRKCDLIEEKYLKAKAYTDKLTQSILAKAFRGELVPQDPNDEPAEVLLEREGAHGEIK